MAIQFLNNVNADSGVLYVDAINDRVGIGTTSPASRLEVNGEIDANGGDGYRIETKPWAYWASDLLTLGDWDGEGYATRIMGSNSSEVMRVTGTNVGIGTTAPGAKLEVNGNSRFVGSMQLYLGSTSNQYLNIFQSSGSTFINTGTSGETIYFGAPSSNTTNVWIQGTITSTSIPAATSDTDKFLVSDSGIIKYRTGAQLASDIGAVTGGPFLPLSGGTLTGDLTIPEYLYHSGDTNTYLRFQSDSIELYTGGWKVFGNTTLKYGALYGDGALRVYATQNGGYVNGSLEVDGTIRGKNYLYLEDPAGTLRTTLRVESTYATLDNGSNTLNYNASNHLFLVGLSEKMRINSSGNVGIGTTTPAPLGTNITTLDISGLSGGGLRFGTTAGVEGAIYTLSSGTYAGSVGNIPLYFRTNNTTKATILANGDVGIGTTSPGEKLEVDGIVKAVDGYKGYVSYFHNGGFFHSPRSSDGANPLWIPINSTGMSSSDQYYNTWVPLYAGRLRKIILKHISGSTPVATVCTFRKKINGVLDSTTYAGTVTGGGAAGMKVTYDFGTSNFTFNAEDEVQIGVVTGVATQPRMGGMSCQIWYEYNIT